MLDARAVRQEEGGHSGARGAFNGPAKGAVLKVGGESVRWVAPSVKNQLRRDSASWWGMMERTAFSVFVLFAALQPCWTKRSKMASKIDLS